MTCNHFEGEKVVFDRMDGWVRSARIADGLEQDLQSLMMDLKDQSS